MVMEIDFPTAGSKVFVDSTSSPNTVSIEGTLPASLAAKLKSEVEVAAVEVYAKCYDTITPPVEEPGKPPGPSFTKCDLSTTSFFKDKVKKAQGGGTTTNNNTMIAWYTDNNGTTWTRADQDIQFIGVDSLLVSGIKVKGKSCLAFAYAPTGYKGPASVGPNGVSDEAATGPEYRPIEVDIPVGATEVVVKSTGGEWRHGPNNAQAADANGLTGQAKHSLDGAYIDAVYNSENIENQSLYLDRLVGLFGDDSGFILTGGKAIIQDIGKNETGANKITIPNGATILFLGMHDGYEWSNNSGEVDVEATFT